MKKASDLNQLTHAELSAAFAVEVAGYDKNTFTNTGGWFFHSGTNSTIFATSMDAVLPHLEEYPFVDCSHDKDLAQGAWCVGVGDYETMDAHYGHSDSMSRAACCALILAARAAK